MTLKKKLSFEKQFSNKKKILCQNNCVPQHWNVPRKANFKCLKVPKRIEKIILIALKKKMLVIQVMNSPMTKVLCQTNHIMGVKYVYPNIEKDIAQTILDA